MLKVKILTLIGTLLIIAGFGLQIIEYQKQLDKYQLEIKEYEKKIKELDGRVDKALTEIYKTNAENQYLWDIYYKSGIANQVRDWE